MSGRRRRYQPTFLLRLVCVVAGIALPVAAVSLLSSLSFALWTGLGLLAALWLVVELDVIPWALERTLAHRAHVTRTRPSSRWFVDAEAEERAASARRRQDVEDNPAVW
jgi:hypothetical protein